MKKRKAAISPRRNPQQNLYHIRIVAQSLTESQHYRTIELSNYIASCELTNAIRRQQLTESLEICERYGFYGKLAILAIRAMQDLMGRAGR